MGRQLSTRMCFVCGFENPIGLRLIFEDDGVRAWARFSPRPEHQGFPGTLHGGIISALLDEVMVRSSLAMNPQLWTLTAQTEVRYLKPVPIGMELTVVGEATEVRLRVVKSRGELRLADGELAAESTGTYIAMPEEMRQAMESEMREWRVLEE